MDEIKAKYDKKIAEQHSFLEQLTKNNKPNLLDNTIEESYGIIKKII